MPKLKRPILRFRAVDKDKLERVYPQEISAHESDFGHPANWKAAHWEAVALHLVNEIRVFKTNRQSLLKRLRSRGIDADKEEERFQVRMKAARVQLAKRAADAKHQPTRDRKKRILAEYSEGRWKSLADAARILSSKHSLSAVTLDHWFRQQRKDKKRSA